MLPIQKAQFLAQCHTYFELNRQLHPHLYCRDSPENDEREASGPATKRPKPGRPPGRRAAPKKGKREPPDPAKPKRKGRPRKNPVVEASNAVVFLNCYPGGGGVVDQGHGHPFTGQPPPYDLSPYSLPPQTLPYPPDLSLFNTDYLNNNEAKLNASHFHPLNTGSHLWQGPTMADFEFPGYLKDVPVLGPANVQPFLNVNVMPQFGNQTFYLAEPARARDQFEHQEVDETANGQQFQNSDQLCPSLAEIMPSITDNIGDFVFFVNHKLNEAVVDHGEAVVEVKKEDAKETCECLDEEKKVEDVVQSDVVDDGVFASNSEAQTDLDQMKTEEDTGSDSLIIDTDYEGNGSDSEADVLYIGDAKLRLKGLL